MFSIAYVMVILAIIAAIVSVGTFITSLMGQNACMDLTGFGCILCKLFDADSLRTNVANVPPLKTVLAQKNIFVSSKLQERKTHLLYVTRLA